MFVLPCAEDVNYWKTGTSAPDTWIAKAIRHIEDVGGEVKAQGFASRDGQAAYALEFEIDDDQFRLVWPVLETRNGAPDDPAARRQAATFIYHDVKAKCMVAKVLGARRALLPYLVTSSGDTVADAVQGQLPSTSAVKGLLT